MERFLVAENRTSMYDIESHIAEIYDKHENYTDDVELIRQHLSGAGPLRILEPFCGTGRIFIPLLLDGHSVTGLDRAEFMLERARMRIESLGEDVRGRATLECRDVIAGEWPQGFDLVILGGNCLYELATAEEQEACISRAAASLKPGGHVYLDNNHMEGELAPSWQGYDIAENAFPTGICDDGTRLRSGRERIEFDIAKRTVKYRRRTEVIFTDGSHIEKEYLMGCHPPSTAEMRHWLESSGFVMEKLFGDRAGGPYSNTSDRAIFWAVKK